ncbi:hypothetical protein DBT_1862 [Dissulfuribacter thermophilus]|uniref:CbbQ/NirQ/NorQ C-terminal domain-containing protein n=1 Tax=Dissulfuribacter thermophilus TaxID=1156395 RepID=A0A1B9F4E7_9BACT|nr:hypothetical protein DBT_1862 [Dissulfuribacter thermophilus]
MLIHAGKLIRGGIEPRLACEVAICQPLTDDHELLSGLSEMVKAVF